jgi:hypothetical protein
VQFQLAGALTHGHRCPLAVHVTQGYEMRPTVEDDLHLGIVRRHGCGTRRQHQHAPGRASAPCPRACRRPHPNAPGWSCTRTHESVPLATVWCLAVHHRRPLPVLGVGAQHHNVNCAACHRRTCRPGSSAVSSLLPWRGNLLATGHWSWVLQDLGS